MPVELPEIKGNRIVLRNPIASDAEDYLRVEPSAELSRMYGGSAAQIQEKTWEEAHELIRKIKANDCEWCIKYNGKFVGQARLAINENDNRARYAIGLFDPAVWGMGLGTETTLLVLCYAFGELGLHRVDLRVLEFNQRAIRCYVKCGFQVEGREREGARIEGKYETDLIMSILDREYETLKKEGRR